MAEDVKKLVGYARTSSSKKNIAEDELIKQKTNIKKWDDRNPASVVIEIREEALSGTLKDRPVRKSIIDDLNKCDGIIVDSLSRWGRSTADTINKVKSVAEKEKIFISVVESFEYDPKNMMSRIMLDLLSVFASVEREFIVERLQSGRAIYVAEGGKLGRKVKHLNDHQKRLAKDYYLKGFSLRPIAKVLSEGEDYEDKVSYQVVREALIEMGVKLRKTNNPKGAPRK